MAAGTGVVPAEIDHLRGHIDLIAQKDGRICGGRGQTARSIVRDQSAGHRLSSEIFPGWRYDLVVYPPDGVDGIPLEDGEPSPEYVESLLAEAQQLLDFGKPRAAFLIAWSAIESTMRTVGSARKPGDRRWSRRVSS